MAKRKTKKRVNTQKRANVILGLFVVFIAFFALLDLGLLGHQLVNTFRLFFGDLYVLSALIFGIFGLVLVIYAKPPRLSVKRVAGFFIFYLMLLTMFGAHYYDAIMVHRDFLSVFWNTMQDEFGRGANTVSVGGGYFGNFVFSIFYPLFGQIGTYLIAGIIGIAGICMFFDLKFVTILHGFQKFAQLFVTKSQDVVVASKEKMQDLKAERDKREQERKEQEAKPFEDPLATGTTDVDLPNTNDFDRNADTTKQATKAVDNTTVIPAEKKADDEVPIFFSDSNESNGERREPKEPEQDTKLNQADEDGAEELSDFAAQTTNEHYQLPPLTLLKPYQQVDQSADKELISKNTAVLQQTFKSFGVDVNVKKAVLGPTVTKYEIQPAVGVKVSRIVNLADDLALALAAKDIRIEAPIPGKPLIGIEVPNKVTSAVAFSDVVEHQPAPARNHSLQVPLGKDVSGQIISANLADMPHLLIAGSTGSGKSVAINTIITSILMKAHPDEVKLVLIDPKMVELSVYNGIPHLLIPVVTDSKLAANALNKAVKEMERRYELFAASGVRNMTEYNARVTENNKNKDNPAMQVLPYMVVIVDELSDLMMVAGREVEAAIVRLAQMARAAGIHMILATQRPSVDVITGLIKANVPSRIAFAVSSGIDSRTILDSQGAEKLIGRGDMLFLPIGANKPVRVQGAYISVDEVENVVEFVRQQQEAEYDETMIPTHEEEPESGEVEDSEDEFFDEAVALVRKQQSASVSMLQRRFRIGYNRAARLVDEMEERGIIGPSEGSKPRKVLLPPED